MGSAGTADAVVGPLTALDGAGQGLVAWGGARSARGQLLAARFDGSGTLGPTQVLAAGGADILFSEPAIAVGADGSAAVAWTAGPRTTVVTGTTADGFDLGTAASVPLGWLVSVAPDGAAVAVGSSSSVSGDKLRIATRRAGRPFTAVGAYAAQGAGDQRPALAIHDGHYVVAFPAKPTIGSSGLGLLQAITGRVGERPGPAVTVPISSAEVLDFAAVLPAGHNPTVLTMTRRSGRYAIDTFVYSSRAARTPRGVRVRVAPIQRLGDPQAIRVEVTCPRRCAVRVAGPVTNFEGTFDSSRTLRAGTTVVSVPYVSADEEATPLRRPRTAELEIAVDDATGELLTDATVSIRP